MAKGAGRKFCDFCKRRGFFDGAGEFTKIRNYLIGYYPEDIRLKKLSACCMALAQTGQYNFERVSKRGDAVTLRTVLARFSDSAIAAVFLLNKAFKPYYKWSYTAMLRLPLLGVEIGRLLRLLAETGGLDSRSFDTQREHIFRICALIADELRNRGLTQSEDWFLTTHGEELRGIIQDEFLRSLPAQYAI